MLLKAKMLILKVTVFFIYNNGKKKKRGNSSRARALDTAVDILTRR